MNANRWLAPACGGVVVAMIIGTIVPQPMWLSARVEVALQLSIVSAGVGLGVLGVVRRNWTLFLIGIGLSFTVLLESYRWGHLTGSAIVLLGVIYAWKTRTFPG